MKVFNSLLLFLFSSSLFAQPKELKSLIKSFEQQVAGLYTNRNFLEAEAGKTEEKPQESRLFRIMPQDKKRLWIYSVWTSPSLPNTALSGRIFSLEPQPDGSYQGKVYYLPESEEFAGSWRNPKNFPKLREQDLKEDLCSCSLKKGSRGWHLKTSNDCQSDSPLAGFAAFGLDVLYANKEARSRTGFYDERGQELFRHSEDYYFSLQSRKQYDLPFSEEYED